MFQFPPVVAQLYVLGTERTDVEVADILGKIAEMGYDSFEALPSNLGGLAAHPELWPLPCKALHTVSADFLEPKAVAETCRTMDTRHVCISGPLGWEDRSEANFAKTIEVLNHAAEALPHLGLHYHNHEFEFNEVRPGVTAMDLVCSHLRGVDLCFDAGWAKLAGVDVPAFLTTHAEKIGFLHLRDFKGSQSVPLGCGDIDLRPITDKLPDLVNLQAVVVEQDPGTTNPVADLFTSLEFLRSL